MAGDPAKWPKNVGIEWLPRIVCSALLPTLVGARSGSKGKVRRRSPYMGL